MTRGDLINQVRFWLDDLQGTYFTDAQVDQWLNNAQYEVQKQLLTAGQYWYMTCATTTLVANQDCYPVPNDFLKVHRMELLTQGVISSPPTAQNWVMLQDLTLQEAAFLNFGTSQPSAFTIGKTCFYLRAIPDQPYVIRLFYAYRVTPMVSDLNVPDVPEQYHEYIAVLATMDGFIKDQRDPSPLLTKKAYYEDMMKKDSIQRDRSSPRRVRRTQDTGYDISF